MAPRLYTRLKSGTEMALWATLWPDPPPNQSRRQSEQVLADLLIYDNPTRPD